MDNPTIFFCLIHPIFSAGSLTALQISWAKPIYPYDSDKFAQPIIQGFGRASTPHLLDILLSPASESSPDCQLSCLIGLLLAKTLAKYMVMVVNNCLRPL